MITPSPTERQVITDQFVRTVCSRLGQNKRVRRKLPVWGRLHLDRQLPFLCVYRRPPGRDDPGTERLVTSEASYLIASGRKTLQPGLAQLAEGVAETLLREFGGFLVLELWSGGPNQNEAQNLDPGFRIIVPRMGNLAAFHSRFEEALSRVSVRKRAADARISRAAKCWPEELPPVLAPRVAERLGCTVLGLQVRPIYRDAASCKVYPLVLRELRRGLSQALQKMFYEFARARTTHRPKHYQVLGRRAMVKAVWEADRALAEVSDTFDFLLQVTPVNTEEAWHEFRRRRFERAPAFRYRPLPLDPAVLKRRLYRAPVERVEDPALAQLFREKQDELDRQITMLSDVNTARFIHGSLQLFGGVDARLEQLAEDLIERLPARTRDDSRSGYLDAAAFARRAEAEIDYYRRQLADVNAAVEIRHDIVSGLMVSHGSLLIGRNTRIPVSRADALLQHEVGTHMLTYYNGRAQPFRQLYCGLAGCDALQEGLSVLAEYLVGGLSRPRLRLLAARVLATRRLLASASFVEVFRELDRTCELGRRDAFTVTLRVYRGGGLTKDAIYLRGLCELIEYLRNGGDLEPLLIGKIAAEHIPIMRELRWRGVLREPPLVPRYLHEPSAAARMERVRRATSMLQLVERKSQ